jgi:hypothetical protein
LFDVLWLGRRRPWAATQCRRRFLASGFFVSIVVVVCGAAGAEPGLLALWPGDVWPSP